jgi:hypothetical protein
VLAWETTDRQGDGLASHSESDDAADEFDDDDLATLEEEFHHEDFL